jgi:pilus assembly protein CpaC
MYTRSFGRLLLPLVICASTSLSALAQQTLKPLEQSSVIFKIRSPLERLEMTVRTSRILTMDQKIPQAQVNNPDIVELTPLSPTQIQVSAKASGVTQINVWGEDKKLFTVDVIVRPDSRELELILQSAFPMDSLKVVPIANSVMISGFVDKPEHIDRIIRIAEEYYPKIINNMTIGGCQQVLLHVKVMEVSRTKLRRLGFDWANISGGNIISSGSSGLLSDSLPDKLITPPGNLFRTTAPSTFAFNVVSGNNAFFGVLDALRQDNLMKVTSEPTLVTVSGRSASFFAGGQVAIPEAGALGTTGVEYKDYGTRIDFVPIVLGNGYIRLEVRPEVSELDYANGTTISGTTVPGFKSRKADTGVELMGGQTLAIAGLVQSRTESENRGLPWISEMPYLGVPFRKVHESTNEVELLILVTPELVEALDANEAPICGPGMQTTSPSDWELFMKGYLEVPNCGPANGCDKGQCQQNEQDSNTPPPDGLISEPNEKIATPQPSADRQPSGRYNRHTSSKANPSQETTSTSSRNDPPGFIGPVGYDVVK